MTKPPVLWLPDYSATAKPTEKPGADPISFLVVQLGYKELLGQAATWDAVRERLERYSLRAVLGLVSKVSAYLNHPGVQDRLDAAQQRICASLFGARAEDLWARAMQARDPQARAMVLFGELQLINMVKVALLCMPPEDRASDTDLAPLGEALLMVSELMWAQAHPGIPSSEAGPLPREWQQMILANGLFHAGGSWANDLARSHELYLTDKPSLRGHPQYVDLPARVRAIVGMEPRTLWSVLLALYSHWGSFDERALQDRNGGFDSRTYFARNYSFSPDEIRSFLGLCAANVKVAQAEVQGCGYTLEKLEPLDFLPLAKAPLIELGGMIYLASAKLLAAKLTRGLYHLFVDQGATASEDRRRFLDFMGPVFEDYVARWMDRVYPSTSRRYCGEAELRARVGEGKSCDGLILFPDVDAAILIECKATLFPHDVRTARSADQFEAVIRRIFVSAAAQLSATIDAIERGALREVGIAPGSIHSYLPVVLTLDDVAMSPPSYQWVLDELTKQGLLGQRQARPLQAVTIGELEAIEEDLLAGESLQRLLAEKVSLNEWKNQPLRNYCFARRPDLGKKMNQRLLAVAEGLVDQAKALFRERQGEG